MSRAAIIVLAGLLFQVANCSAASGRLSIDSDPQGFDAWAGQVHLGRTPLEADVEAGAILLRLARSDSSLYVAPAIDTLIYLAAGERKEIRVRVGRSFSVRSIPFGYPVLRDGQMVGRTPIDVLIGPELGRGLILRTPHGGVGVPLDTLLQRGGWTYIDRSLGLSMRPPQRPAWRRVGRFAMPVLAIGLAAAGVLFEDSADRSYARYQRETDPSRIVALYDETRRRDRWASALWIGAEISLTSTIIAWILPERNGAHDRGEAQ